MKTFEVEFVTMQGRTFVKIVKAHDYEDACAKLDKRYKIAYFNDVKEVEKHQS